MGSSFVRGANRRVHADRAAGRHRDHRRPDRPALARRAVGPRGGPPDPVHQQPQADRPGRRTTTRAPTTSFPMGGQFQTARQRRTTGPRWSGVFVPMIPYFEQGTLYNAYNFNSAMYNAREHDDRRDRDLDAVVPERPGDRADALRQSRTDHRRRALSAFGT